MNGFWTWTMNPKPFPKKYECGKKMIDQIEWKSEFYRKCAVAWQVKLGPLA